MMVMNKISRRHFLAATGAITGAALLNPLSEVAAKAVENPNVAGKNFALLLLVLAEEVLPCGDMT